MSDDVPHGIGTIWNNYYPFEYWENRLAKLEPENSNDSLDAMFVLSHLSDVYVTVLAAKLKRPNFVWYVVKNELLTHQIYNTLEPLEEETESGTQYFVGKLIEGPDELVSIDLPPEWRESVDKEAAFVNQFLGCPAEFNHEKKHLQLYYDPGLYRGICNSVINYWDENRNLLNDFKHGFRVLPFSWESLTQLLESEMFTADISFEEVKQGYDEMDSNWTYDYWRIVIRDDKQSQDGVVPVDLGVYTADIEKCIAYSNLILKLLYNMFETGYTRTIDVELEKLLQGNLEEPMTVIHQQYSMETKFRD